MDATKSRAPNPRRASIPGHWAIAYDTSYAKTVYHPYRYLTHGRMCSVHPIQAELQRFLATTSHEVCTVFPSESIVMSQLRQRPLDYKQPVCF